MVKFVCCSGNNDMLPPGAVCLQDYARTTRLKFKKHVEMRRVEKGRSEPSQSELLMLRLLIIVMERFALKIYKLVTYTQSHLILDPNLDPEFFIKS